MRESRLSRRSVNQSKKQLYASLFAIVVIIFIALNFGPFLIGRVGTVIDTISGKSSQSAQVVSDTLEAPVIDLLPSATPSASIDVQGHAFYSDGQIELYVNDSRVDTVDLDNSQSFTFESVRLRSGENSLKVRIEKNGKKSDFSEEYTISYVKDTPKLEVSSPSDGASFTKADQEINVSGTTDPDNNVRVNNFIAIVDSQGNFSYRLKLNEGENKIKIEAENLAGNKSSKDLTVSYSP